MSSGRSERVAGRPTVVVVRTRPETYGEDLQRAWRLLHLRRRAVASRERESVVLLPPLESRGPGTVVAPWTLDAVLSLARERGTPPPPVFAASGPTIAVRTAGTGIDRVLERHHATLVTPQLDLEIAAARAELAWLRGKRGTALRVDTRWDGRAAWVVAPLRRSRRLGIRGAVDAAIATVATARERRGSPLDVQLWCDLLALHRALHPWRTYVLDATVCGSDDERDRPLLRDLVLMGHDPVACDVVGAALSGSDPMRLPWLRRVADSAGSPLSLAALDIRGEAFDARSDHAAAPSVRPRLDAPSRVPRWIDALDPTRWVARWRRRRWDDLYRRSPWGRLHEDYRTRGEARTARSQPQESR